MKKDPYTIVKFGFMSKTYYRDTEAGCPPIHEIKGRKTLKLFKSWFRLMKNRGRLLYGYVEFLDGEIWIWQNPDRVYRAGWQKFQSGEDDPTPIQLSLEFD